MFFFPKLLAGPIIKYHEMEDQLRALPAARIDDISTGFVRFMLGAAKKTLIADTLATGADQIFAADPAGIGFAHAWCGVIFFSFQIYFDFSGYSDMAIGIARMLGFRLRENFDMPYIACSITEFWRRWHISLTTWIREYLYIPLGGNRVSPIRVYINLWVCFLASGLWHGAAWTYVAWGAYNGLFLVLDRLFLLRLAGPYAAGRRQPPHLRDRPDSVGRSSAPAHGIRPSPSWACMMQPGAATHVAGIYIPTDQLVAALLAAVICALPRMPGFRSLRHFILAEPRWALALQIAISLLFVAAVGKASRRSVQAVPVFPVLTCDADLPGPAICHSQSAHPCC